WRAPQAGAARLLQWLEPGRTGQAVRQAREYDQDMAAPEPSRNPGVPGLMSRTEDDIVLAAEYVLGTLDADEMTAAERLIEEDAQVAALVRDWERRLGELNALVGAVEPPADQFAKIRTRIESIAQPTAIHLPDPAGAARSGGERAFELGATRPGLGMPSPGEVV